MVNPLRSSTGNINTHAIHWSDFLLIMQSSSFIYIGIPLCFKIVLNQTNAGTNVYTLPPALPVSFTQPFPVMAFGCKPISYLLYVSTYSCALAQKSSTVISSFMYDWKIVPIAEMNSMV